MQKMRLIAAEALNFNFHRLKKHYVFKSNHLKDYLLNIPLVNSINIH